MQESHSQIHVLVVDDDPADRELARLALDKAEHGEFRVHFAINLGQARQKLEEETVHIVLLDLSLPECCGNQTLARIRDTDAQVPIIVLTDLCDMAMAMECLEQGAQDYLLKSQLARDVLNRAIRYALLRHQLWQQLTATNQLLLQRNAQLAQVGDAAERFVDHVSHDFLAPLSAIREYVGLLREGAVGHTTLDADQHRCLDLVADLADELQQMANDLLEANRLDAGLCHGWRRRTKLQHVVRQKLPGLQAKVALRGIRLETDIPDDLPDIFCDPDVLGRVLVTLVTSALPQLSASGAVRLHANEDQTRGEVKIVVSYDGPSLKDTGGDAHGDLLCPLAYAERRSEGWSLGLSVAKQHVELNFGELRCESPDVRRGEFSFTVPLADLQEVVRRYGAWLTKTGHAKHVRMVHVSAVATAETEKLDGADAVLHMTVRPHDLLLRVASGAWLYISPAHAETSSSLELRVRELLADRHRNRPHQTLPDLSFLVGGIVPLEGPRLVELALKLVTRRETNCVSV